MRTIALLLVCALAACSDDGTSSQTPAPDAGTEDAGTDTSPDAEPDEGQPSEWGCDEEDGLLCAYQSPSALDPQTAPVMVGMGTVPSVGGREVPIAMWVHPDLPAGEVPVLIWSHGGGYNRNAHSNRSDWGTHFATQGFAVVQIAHIHPTEDQLQVICESVGITTPEECVDLTLDRDGDEEADDNPFSSIGVSRPADGSAVIDRLADLSASLVDRGIELDLDNIVVAGWSGGTQTVMQMAGAKRNLSASVQAYAAPDPRPAAFIAVSPQGPGYSGFYEEEGGSWDEVRGPILVMTGDGDEKRSNDLTGPIRRRAFNGMADGDKVLFYSTLDGEALVHGSYNLGGDENDDDTGVLHTALRAMASAFLDSHVRGVEEAGTWIEDKTAIAVTGGNAEVEQR